MIKKIFSLITVTVLLLNFSGCSLKGEEKSNKYTATVEAESFYIPAEISGKIENISVEQGKEIKANQVVAQIESKGLEIQKQQAEAVLNIAKLKKDDLPSKASSKVKDQAEEAVKQAQASVDLLSLQIEKTKVTSANDGVISDVFLHKGEIASPGMNIAKAINLKTRYVKIYVEEEKRNEIKLNSNFPIYYNGKDLGQGKVIYISPESEFTPKNVEKKSDKEKTVFEVKLKLDDNTTLMPGTMVDVELR
ncbi:HlyD family efflux transporter periplasmic adaptor subunit [Clostridium sp. YIM B02515]|uniref:HlyD family efflux transporter periplasmic adaptor subunit n=1 Tax=Clostridium rhizosphaerae TaxID=2803861 RepID=A0ABS1TIK4_9CLOT|nr:HlyD family efflux transporter periplasmic adaptor subunit [Clostridium rhizosphaerae]MBL4938617.1 HlyD family efflux transporter periplasmic adaptor subunit [Clostridium rhizosphaerae]